MAGMTISRGIPTALAVGAASVLLAACGASGSGGGGGTANDDEQELAFAACLRKAGIDAPDPQRTPDGGRRSQVRVPRGISPQRMKRIQQDCMNKSGFRPKQPSKAEQARFLDAALKFSRCMRAHGVDIPDPQATGGGILLGKPGSTSKVGPNVSAPAFKRAQAACQTLLPGGKGGKGGFAVSGGSKGPGISSAAKP
jgi:hypothetical protein